ncbi:MAG: gliding motility-associated C-terminal domain-containing protein [Bacteroidetes bacterium]|nr:gliding motility-associated C-terminal domain-containing protein [Bacteroidota bacterium]
MRFYQTRILTIIFFTLTAQFSVAQIFADFTFSNITCNEDTVYFLDNSSGISISSWEWDFGDGQTATTQHTNHVYQSEGDFTVQLKISDGTNIDSKSKIITIYKNPVVDFIVDSIPFSTYSKRFSDNSQSDTKKDLFEWDFNDGSLILSTESSTVDHKFPDKGVYDIYFKITDINGCDNDTIKSITIEDDFVVPNVFTPNGDGVNDLFCITSNGEVKFSITIYSRWGSVMYKSQIAQQICWDARNADGSKVQPGTYFYVIQLEGNTDYEPKTGFFNVFY